MSHALCRTTLLALSAVLAACAGSSAPAPVDYLDESVEHLHSLGWLGGRAHPSAVAVEVPVKRAREPLACGGMVVAQVFAGAPLASAGVARGDVIVGVGGEWLPNKEDPGLDLVDLVERAVSAEAQALELDVLSAGRLRSARVEIDVAPLEVGLPAAVVRFASAADAGLARLARLQQGDGSFPTAAGTEDAETAVAALAGLAFLAGGSTLEEGEHAARLALCEQRVRAALDDEASELGSFALAFATAFLAELAGTGQHVADVGEMQVTAIAPGQEVHLPARGLPEGVEVSELLAHALGESVQVHSAQQGGEIPEALRARIERRRALQSAVERLVALQQDDGGWPLGAGTEPGYSETTLATNQALLALGVAERAGLALDDEVIERACARLKALTGDGRVIAPRVAGFDRRREAGRSAGAAAALNALGCLESDEFLAALVRYDAEHGRDVGAGGGAAWLGLLNTALLRRQRGGPAWQTFFDDFRHLFVALQDPDGTFAALPLGPERTAAFEREWEGEAFRCALASLALSLQSDRLPLLLCRRTSPLASPRTGDGERTERPDHTGGGGELPAEFGEGMMIQVGSPEELQEMLEKLGADGEGGVQVMTVTGGGGKHDEEND